MRETVQLPSLSNVAAGSRATLQCPLGPTYDIITLEYSGVTLAQLKNIRVEINGKPIQEYESGVVVDSINKYYSRPVTAGQLDLYFLRPEMSYEPGSDRVTGIGTLDVQTLQISMDIDAAAVAPVIVASAERSDPQPLGIITKVKRWQFAAAVSGQFEIDNIPRTGRVMAMHLRNANITAIEVEIDRQKVLEGSRARLEGIQTRWGRSPQTADMLSVDWCLDGDPKQALAFIGRNRAQVQDFRLRPTISAAGAVPIYVEYLDAFHGI